MIDLVAGLLNDLHTYDLARMSWIDLSAASQGIAPSPRYGHGFTAADGQLYVHGGADANGKEN